MADPNVIKKADLARAREIDFVYKFNDGIKKLIEVLGVTRKIPKVAGTNLKAYKATGDLQDGNVAEGDVIPLSHYKTVPVTFAELTMKKWRKATSAEAITEKGYNQAVTMTNEAAIKDAQMVIKKDFFSFLATGTGQATGTTFQATLASIWGQLQVLYEDTEFEAVYFMNPLDVADYLGQAGISTQNAFGMRYVEDFLGLGTVILVNSVPKGTIYGTAKENIVLYYIPVNGADLDEAFEFTSDDLGYIGIHEEPDYNTMTAVDVIVCGVVLFAERIDGVVVGRIGGTITPTITLDRTAATVAVGRTITLVPTVSPAGSTITWASDDTSKATVSDGVVTGVAEGSATITATNGTASATCTVTVSAGA